MTAPQPTPPRAPWRLVAPLVFALAGVLFVTSAVSTRGTDIRADRFVDLPSLARSEADRVEELRARQAELAAEIDALTASLGGIEPGPVERAVRGLRGPAGLEPVHGPGLTVVLDDAPDDVADDVTGDVNDLVVHQQDIQAVVNALWAWGAEAMTIQGQRVISTTGVRCVGNTVVLHDVPYAPPYVISAIGPTDAMLNGLYASPYIGFYLQAVEAYQLGWDVRVEPDLRFPGYTGSTDLVRARPMGLADAAADRT